MNLICATAYICLVMSGQLVKPTDNYKDNGKQRHAVLRALRETKLTDNYKDTPDSNAHSKTNSPNSPNSTNDCGCNCSFDC